jgi:hypothetical protein
MVDIQQFDILLYLCWGGKRDGCVRLWFSWLPTGLLDGGMNSTLQKEKPGAMSSVLRDLMVEKKSKHPIDELTGFDVLGDFEGSEQRKYIYSRSQWDPEVKSDKAPALYALQSRSAR